MSMIYMMHTVYIGRAVGGNIGDGSAILCLSLFYLGHDR